MSAPAATRRQKKHKDRPVYFIARTMMDVETGEVAGCLVPSSWSDARILRERKIRTNDLLRTAIHNPRNSKFHRLVHQLGTLVRENIDGFEYLNSHETVKRLQADSGVHCEPREVDAAPLVNAILDSAKLALGESAARMLAAALPEIQTLQIMTPRSIAYDCMDELEFRQFWSGICEHLITRYWPGLTEEQITDMADLMPKNQEL